MSRELEDPETAKKLARAFDALQRGQSLDKAAAYASLDKRVLVRILESLKKWVEGADKSEPSPPPEGAVAATRSRPQKRAGKTGIKKLIAFTDGASRGNPGEAACAAILFDEKNEELLRRSKRLGITTNNVAEYEGVLLALELSEALGARDVDLRLDSELIVRQLNGQYRVKHPVLKPLFERTRKRMEHFARVSVSHVRREENKLADKLANAELDGKAGEP